MSGRFDQKELFANVEKALDEACENIRRDPPELPLITDVPRTPRFVGNWRRGPRGIEKRESPTCADCSRFLGNPTGPGLCDKHGTWNRADDLACYEIEEGPK